MEFIANDKGGDWFFDGVRYICMDKAKNVIGRINGEYLPDPIKIWTDKCDSIEFDMHSDLGKQLRPNKVVYKLWEHHNANTNK